MTGRHPPGASAVVTGAASGIGRAVAAELLAQRIAVVAIDLDETRLAQLAADHPGLLPLAGDVADPSILRRAADLASRAAPLRMWVNNAAAIPAPPRPLLETAPAEVQRILSVSLIAVIEGMRVAVERFVGDEIPGSVVNVSSVHARRAFAGWTAYSAAKAGLEAATRVAAAEYGHHGIRVNAVAPALVAVERWHEQQAALGSDEADRRERRTQAQYPLARIAEPREVAAAIAYLLSDRSSYVTGTTLRVDGGFSIQHVMAGE